MSDLVQGHIKDKTAREIIAGVQQTTGITITISLKNKKGIIKKAEHLLTSHYTRLNAARKAGPTPVEQEAANMGLSVDQYLEYKASQETEAVDGPAFDTDAFTVPIQELAILDLRGVSRWKMRRMLKQVSGTDNGFLSTLFGSRSDLAETLFKAINASKANYGKYDDFICQGSKHQNGE